jgi:hypothetical protein
MQCSEVDCLGASIRREAHVAWTDIAMQQPVRAQQREQRRDVTEMCADLGMGQGLLQISPAQQLYRVVRSGLH